jgi:hypothetical protein
MRVTCLHAGWLASLPEGARNQLVAALTPVQARALSYKWPFWARPSQLPPNGNWRVWSSPAADSARRALARK